MQVVSLEKKKIEKKREKKTLPAATVMFCLLP